MIKISKDFMIDHRLLNEKEVDKFIYCLTLEKSRHETEIGKCSKLLSIFKTKIVDNNIILKFYKCQIKRHEIDIKNIDKTIRYLMDKFYGEINESASC